MMPILKLCPKCGEKPKMMRGLPNMGNSKFMWARVQCLSCKYRTKRFIQEKHQSYKEVTELAADAWNNNIL